MTSTYNPVPLTDEEAERLKARIKADMEKPLKILPPPPRPQMLAYDLPLRLDLMIRLTLPRDFTPEDAERLCGIIRTLPFEADAP